jgi:deoxyribose-phosphate aldolase
MDSEKIVEKNTEKCAGNECNRQSKGGNDNIAGFIDHTLLKQDATEEQIAKLCEEAKKYHFCSVCINSCYVPLSSKLLYGSGVNVCTVIGFPLGAASTKAKIAEANEAIENGATEVDMVINVGSVKSGNYDNVKRDIEGVVFAAKGKALVKVIIETCLLTDEEKVRVCTICKLAGADFVKTSTGFSTGGATVDDVRLMRKTVGPNMGVKASGGIKSYETALAMIEAGATRLGTSSGIDIVNKVVKTNTKG